MVKRNFGNPNKVLKTTIDSSNIYQTESDNEIIGNTAYKIWPYFILTLLIGFILFSIFVYHNWFINLIISILMFYEGYIVLARFFHKHN